MNGNLIKFHAGCARSTRPSFYSTLTMSGDFFEALKRLQLCCTSIRTWFVDLVSRTTSMRCMRSDALHPWHAFSSTNANLNCLSIHTRLPIALTLVSVINSRKLYNGILQLARAVKGEKKEKSTRLIWARSGFGVHCLKRMDDAMCSCSD